MSDTSTEDISISVWVLYPDLENPLKNVKIPLDCTPEMLEVICQNICPGEHVYNIKLVSSHSNSYNNILPPPAQHTYFATDVMEQLQQCSKVAAWSVQRLSRFSAISGAHCDKPLGGNPPAPLDTMDRRTTHPAERCWCLLDRSL